MNWGIFILCIATAYGWDRENYPNPTSIEWKSDRASKVFHFHKMSNYVDKNALSMTPDFYQKSFSNMHLSSSSQSRQDLTILDVLNNTSSGFFIDIGANHFQLLSNTFYLERKFNWNGLCIEPNPEYHQAHLENRKCLLFKNAIGAISGRRVVFRLRGTGSGVVGKNYDTKPHEKNHPEVKIPLVTLYNILVHVKAPRVIDYLSLDVEGYEYEVLKNFDFGVYTFLVMTVERPKPALHRLLINNEYTFFKCMAFFGDIGYIHKSIPNYERIVRSYASSRYCSWTNYTENAYMWESNQD